MLLRVSAGVVVSLLVVCLGVPAFGAEPSPVLTLPTVLICTPGASNSLVTNCQFAVNGNSTQLTPRAAHISGYTCNEVNYDGYSNTTGTNAAINCAIARANPPYSYMVTYYDPNYAGQYSSLSDIPTTGPNSFTVTPGESHGVTLQGNYRWYYPVSGNFAFGGYTFVSDSTATNNFRVTGVINFNVSTPSAQIATNPTLSYMALKEATLSICEQGCK